MSAPGEVMCVLCRAVGRVETDVDVAEGPASAFAWALHFVAVHPDAPKPVARYLVMVPASGNSGEGGE
jgi:hypothetical protein